MASYFLAPSLVSLRNEINAVHPRRDKGSDGWIGDAAHSARKSDHNPDYAAGGIVRALDVDKDGIDINRLLAVAIRDPRVEYVIWNGGIYTRQNGFRRANYTGANKHKAHMHISIRHTAAGAAAGGWGYSGGAPAPAPAPSPSAPGRAPDGSPWGSGKPYDVVAREVLRGEWGVGVDRQNRLKVALYDPAIVQQFVNAMVAGRPLPSAPAPAQPARKTNEQIAAEVRAGHWGNNPQRSQRLQQAGYNPIEIQRIINGGGGTGGAVRLSVNALARQVIAGQWGNGAERERRIRAAGYDYAAVRAEVNRLL